MIAPVPLQHCASARATHDAYTVACFLEQVLAVGIQKQLGLKGDEGAAAATKRAAKMLTQLQRLGRYVVEAWS